MKLFATTPFSSSTTIICHSFVVCVALFLLLLATVPGTVQSCEVTGGKAPAIAGNEVTCDGEDACQNAVISNCDTVRCGQRDCYGATMTNVTNVFCDGESACNGATIGTVDNPAESVACRGTEWTCYQATIVANRTVRCDDIGVTTPVSSTGVCSFATLTTPCLQCVGSNHGCDTTCKLAGEPCPKCRCAGTDCGGVCPAEEDVCPVGENATQPTSAAFFSTTSSSSATTAMIMSGSCAVAMGFLLH